MSETQRADLFNPEREGWAKRERLAHSDKDTWDSPCKAWRLYLYDVGDIVMYDVRKMITRYTGVHPTTALVHEIIRINGGDDE